MGLLEKLAFSDQFCECFRKGTAATWMQSQFQALPHNWIARKIPSHSVVTKLQDLILSPTWVEAELYSSFVILIKPFLIPGTEPNRKHLNLLPFSDPRAKKLQPSGLEQILWIQLRRLSGWIVSHQSGSTEQLWYQLETFVRPYAWHCLRRQDR